MTKFPSECLLRDGGRDRVGLSCYLRVTSRAYTGCQGGCQGRHIKGGVTAVSVKDGKVYRC